MSSKYLAYYINACREALQDENSDDYRWTNPQLISQILRAVREVSMAVPQKTKATLATVASSKDVDITSLTDIVDIYEVEYPVGEEPQALRNVKPDWGTVLTMEIDFKPGATGEDVYVYYGAFYALTSESTTVPARLEQSIIDGAVAHAALAWISEGRSQIAEATTLFSTAQTAIGNLTARITQAVSDLTAGRAYIAKCHTEAHAAIGNMTARLTQAMDDLTSGRGDIGKKLTEADAAIASVSARITQAVSDLLSARNDIGQKKTEADAAILAMAARITQAGSDLTSGRDLINTVTHGGPGVPSDYGNYAARELQTASEYLTQARGYLAEDQTVTGYGVNASRELNAALAYLSQARAYLSEDMTVGEYGGTAARELQVANTYLAQARAYLAEDQPATEYLGFAARELNAGSAYLSQAGSYLSEITSKLNVARMIQGYQRDAERDLSLFKADLRKLVTARSWQQYPRSR